MSPKTSFSGKSRKDTRDVCFEHGAASTCTEASEGEPANQEPTSLLLASGSEASEEATSDQEPISQHLASGSDLEDLSQASTSADQDPTGLIVRDKDDKGSPGSRRFLSPDSEKSFEPEAWSSLSVICAGLPFQGAS